MDARDVAISPVAPALLEAHVPERGMRFLRREPARWFSTRAGLFASALLHAGGFALAAWLIAAAPPALEAGGEEAIPIEVVIAGAVDSAASEAGARSADVAIDFPLPPDAPVTIALSEVEVPPVPDAPPVQIATAPVEVPPLPEVAVMLPQPAREVPPPPDAPPVEIARAAPASVELPSLPDAPELSPDLVAPPPKPRESEVAAVKPEIVEAEKPPAPVLTKPPENKSVVEKPREKPRAIEKPKTVAKPEQRKLAARPVENPRPQPVEAPRPAETMPAPAARGRGDAGTGESDSARASSARGATGGTGASGGAAVVANYRSLVNAHLARYKNYPEQARERNITGRVVVAFTLSRNGQVLSASIAGGSGSMLDAHTLATVRRASPFPPSPDGASTSFSIPMNYNLR